jgi:hypothetical protein
MIGIIRWFGSPAVALALSALFEGFAPRLHAPTPPHQHQSPADHHSLFPSPRCPTSRSPPQVAPGSELWLLNAVPATERDRKLDAEGTRRELQPKNLVLRHVEANPLCHHHLAAPIRAADPRTGHPLDAVPPLALSDFKAVVVLSDAEPVRAASASGESAASVDSRSMATLLLAKSHLGAGGKEPVVELQDPSSAGLLGQLGQTEGGVGTSRLAALTMAIAAEDRKAGWVYAELLSAGGAYVDIRTVERYLGARSAGSAGWWLSFWEMGEAVRRAGDALIGYRPRGQTWVEARATLVNPSGKAERRQWEEGDRLVVIRHCDAD